MSFDDKIDNSWPVEKVIISKESSSLGICHPKFINTKKKKKLLLYPSVCEILYVFYLLEKRWKYLGVYMAETATLDQKKKKKLVWILPVTMNWLNLAILKIDELDCAVSKFFLDPLGLHLLYRNIVDCLATWVFLLATWEYKVIEFTLKACLFMEMIYC